MNRFFKIFISVCLALTGLLLVSSIVLAKTWTIEITSTGFNPSSIRIDGGDTVTFKNLDTKSYEIASDPHPLHNQNPEMNLGLISAGQEKSVMLNKQGLYGYHDHLDPTKTGKIIVDTENPDAPSIANTERSSNTLVYLISAGFVGLLILLFYFLSKKGESKL